MKSPVLFHVMFAGALGALLTVPACDRPQERASHQPPGADRPQSAGVTAENAQRPAADAAPSMSQHAATPDVPPPRRQDKAPDKPPADPMADKPAAKLPGGTAFPDFKPKEEDDPPPQRPKRDLGPPLVDNFKDLTRLNPKYPVWLDGKNKRVVMVGEVCRATMGLEMFACVLESEKDYESVVVVDTLAQNVHAGLLAAGATPGAPVQFLPEYRSAWGTEIEIQLIWKDAAGKIQRARAQEWMKDVRTGKPIEENWVFAGSAFWKNETTGEQHYLGEGGYLICVANTSSAVLDLPIPSSAGLEARLFESNGDRVPPRGTPVTLVLVPRLDKPVTTPVTRSGQPEEPPAESKTAPAPPASPATKTP